MPSLPTTGAEVESLVRELIAASVATVAGVGNVFTKPFFVAGKQEYVALLGVENSVGESVEVRYLFIMWHGFEDTDRGCEDAPVYFTNYKLRVGQEFIPERPDGGSSEQDFSAFCMALRDSFLPVAARKFGYPQLLADRLVVAEDVALQDDPHTGMFGHTIEFLLRVEVTPVG